MRLKSKVTTVLLILIMVTLTFSTVAFAKEVYTPGEFKGEIDTTTDGTSNIKDIGGEIVGIIRVVGTIVAVGMIMVLGIKYMMGSAEERAEYKKTLFPYIVGAVLIFGASNLAQIIYSWASNI